MYGPFTRDHFDQSQTGDGERDGFGIWLQWVSKCHVDEVGRVKITAQDTHDGYPDARLQLRISKILNHVRRSDIQTFKKNSTPLENICQTIFKEEGSKAPQYGEGASGSLKPRVSCHVQLMEKSSAGSIYDLDMERFLLFKELRRNRRA